MALYAISYDDQVVLAETSKALGIDYPLLSDIDSAVIRAYGILNTEALERLVMRAVVVHGVMVTMWVVVGGGGGDDSGLICVRARVCV